MVWQVPDTVDTVVCAPDDGGRYHPKHVEQFPDIKKLSNVASCWIYIGICQQIFRFAQCCLFRLCYSEFWHHTVLLRGCWCHGRPRCFHLRSWRIWSKSDTDVIGVRMPKLDSILSWFWLATFLATELVQPNHILTFDHSSINLDVISQTWR